MSNHVGPLLLAHPIARGQFLSTGEVITFRAGEPRTTGETHVRWTRTGKGMADVRVDRLRTLIPSEDTARLEQYLDRSGFRSVDAWRDAMADLNGAVPEYGHLYHVTFQRPREPLTAFLRDEYGLTTCDACEEQVAPYVLRDGGSASGTQNGVDVTVSWCSWDETGLDVDERPEGWRFTLPEPVDADPEDGDES